MASSGKKKNNKKGWKPVPVDAVIDANVKKTNWADEVDQVYQDDANDYVSQKPVVLPTAPRASRASDFDESKIPHVPPFQIHVSNIPYELDDDELAHFFGDLQVKSVRLPKEEGKRAKGYGYVEFYDRASLIAALNKPDTVIKNRSIKIELSTADSRGGMRGGPRGNRDGGMRGDMGGPDRTAGNWRSGPRDDVEDRSGGFDRGGSGPGYGGEGRRDFSSGSGGGFRGGFDREDRGFRDDRGGGSFRDDRDRGFDNRDRDRFQRDDRRRDDFSRGFRDDRGDRGFRDNRDRDRGFRDNRGFDEDRRDDRAGGGSWRDDRPRDNFSDRGDRSGFDRRRDDRDPPGRFDRGARRDDFPPPDRTGPPMERKKLNLQPRSVAPPADSRPAPAASSAIFGGAKPVDTTAREREVEERLARGEDFAADRSGGHRSGPGSTSGGSTKDHQESEHDRDVAVEPAPPPKENPWHRKPTSPVVNNGRTSPDGPSSDDRGEGQRAWGRGDSRRPEPRRTDDQRSRGPPPKSGPASGPDKGRPREDRPPYKSREPRNIDDVSKMPKMVENKAPNFTGANKFTTLETDDGAE